MRKGFTVVEMIMVMLTITLLVGGTSLRLLNISQIASVKNTANQLISDIRNQQTKAMATDTQATGNVSDFSIYFETGQYTLFHGSTYSASDPTNLVVTLDRNIQFSSITFPGSTLVLTRGSGETGGFVAGQNTVTVRNSVNGEQKVITVNRYGVVTGVN